MIKGQAAHWCGSDFHAERLMDNSSMGVPSAAHGWLQIRETELVAVDQELLPIGYADLVENAGQMMANCTVTNGQLIGDFFIGQSSPHQSNHLSFALGQGGWPGGRLCS